ncbi:hypothetical protein G6F57_017706 [Rhizopus arrhizus]|nr:hypothetical protein G6F57_017706 [Rhizopus arrhizus]
MVIEHAERFGLAQLHQLRGRVGRGTAESVCVLLYQTPLSQIARERLRAMFETSDGFEIARRDLEQRGPGEFLGTRQSGMALLRFADLETDAAIAEDARDAARRPQDLRATPGGVVHHDSHRTQVHRRRRARTAFRPGGRGLFRQPTDAVRRDTQAGRRTGRDAVRPQRPPARHDPAGPSAAGQRPRHPAARGRPARPGARPGRRRRA